MHKRKTIWLRLKKFSDLFNEVECLMPINKRSSNEKGHKSKYLVIIDETPECDKAIYFAAKRAKKVDSTVVLLAVVPDAEYVEWAGISSMLEQESEDELNNRLASARQKVLLISGTLPETFLRKGNRAKEIIKYVEEDTDVSFLVLAAGTGQEGPGPLISHLVGKGATEFSIPIAIIPPTLTEDDIDSLA